MGDHVLPKDRSEEVRFWLGWVVQFVLHYWTDVVVVVVVWKGTVVLVEIDLGHDPFYFEKKLLPLVQWV